MRTAIGIVLMIVALVFFGAAGLGQLTLTQADAIPIDHGPPLQPEPEVHELPHTNVLVQVQHLNDGTRCAVLHGASGISGITCDWARNEWISVPEESDVLIDKRPAF